MEDLDCGDGPTEDRPRLTGFDIGSADVVRTWGGSDALMEIMRAQGEQRPEEAKVSTPKKGIPWEVAADTAESRASGNSAAAEDAQAISSCKSSSKEIPMPKPLPRPSMEGLEQLRLKLGLPPLDPDPSEEDEEEEGSAPLREAKPSAEPTSTTGDDATLPKPAPDAASRDAVAPQTKRPKLEEADKEAEEGQKPSKKADEAEPANEDGGATSGSKKPALDANAEKLLRSVIEGPEGSTTDIKAEEEEALTSLTALGGINVLEQLMQVKAHAALATKLTKEGRLTHSSMGLPAPGTALSVAGSKAIPPGKPTPSTPSERKFGPALQAALQPQRDPWLLAPFNAAATDGAATADAATDNTPRIYNSEMLQMRPGTKRCREYCQMGYCRKGSACPLDHPERNGRGAGLFGMDTDGSVMLPPTGFTSAGNPFRPGVRGCHAWQRNGRCDLGHNCPYDHPIEGRKVAVTRARGFGTQQRGPFRDFESRDVSRLGPYSPKPGPYS